MDTAEQLKDKVDDPSTSMAPSINNADNLQGIYVYQLPFPGTLPEKAQREQLAVVVRKYAKIVEIRFDAIPNNPDASTVQAGRRYQLPPLSRRALIVFQKTSVPSFEALLAELNKQVMSQCHLSASTAKAEHINALIAMRNAASVGHNATKAHPSKAQPGQTTSAEQSQQPQYSSKRPMTLLKIQPPAPAVKAFAMDSQTHTQPDPFHKNASRTLYVKHLDNTITEEELKVRYGKFGHILDIEVKNRNTMAPYAFIQFTNIESVANAIKAFNQQFEECGGARQKKFSNLHWWGNTIVTSRLWIGRLPPNCGEQYLMSKMRVVLTQPDDVTQVIYDASFNEAIVMFVGHESTQIAFNKVKNRNITFQPERSSITEPVHHVHVDFCSEKLHDYFIDRLYGKNTEPLLSDTILAPPPDPPKCLTSAQLKKSPSPPPDPSIESVGNCSLGSKRSVGRQKGLLVEQQQPQTASHSLERTIPSYNTKMGRTVREMTAHVNLISEEVQTHRERTVGGKTQENSERSRLTNVRHVRSNSSSSNTSTDTYSQSPRKRWRHPSQPSESNEFSGGRHKITTKKSASSETKHKWERKHRSQRSTERRRETRVERREKRRERMRSRTRKTTTTATGTARRTEGERSGDVASGGDRSKRGDHAGGTTALGSIKRSRTISKIDKYKGRSKEMTHTKTSSNSGCQLLPPPPAPPFRFGKANDQHKKRRSTTSSSDSHSSCTCSSCSSNSSSNSRTNSLSENSDSEFSSSDNELEVEDERPSTRRSHRSRKDGLFDGFSQTVSNNQPSAKEETPNVSTMQIRREPLPLTASSETKSIDTEILAKNSASNGRKSEKTSETKEESTEISKNKKGGEQSQRKDQTATSKNEAVSKKANVTASSLSVQPSQTAVKVQMPRPSQRTVLGIPLDAQSTPPPSDPRLTRSKQQLCAGATDTALCLELPRFVQKMKAMAANSGDRPSTSNMCSEETTLTEQLTKSTPIKTVPTPTIDWIKHEPEFNAENEQHLKVKQEEEQNEREENPTTDNTLNLMASITERIKNVENGITEFRIAVQATEETKASTNFDQIELEVLRIRTELTNGIPLEQLEQSIAQRSVIIAQMNASADTAGGGRQLHPKTTVDSFHTSTSHEFTTATKGVDEETEKNKRNDETTESGGLHDRRCSFVSEPDMPTRSYSLSCDHHPMTSSAKSVRLPHEKEQFTPPVTTPLSASPLTKQPTDAGNAFPRKQKHLMESLSTQTQIRNTVGITKLKEIKLDRKPSVLSLPNVGDPWTTNTGVASLNSFKKEKEVKNEQREHRSDSVGHLPTTTPKEKRKELGMAKANAQPIPKKIAMTAAKTHPKHQPNEERKADPSVALSGIGGGGHSDSHKKQFKVRAKTVDNESASDGDRQHKKQKRKKRPTEQSPSGSSEESLDESELFNEVDIEEQKRMLAAIKSGIGFGLSMYDRVKRRSSQRPDDEQKKKTALEVLRTKQTKKKKEFSRVRLSSTSSDSERSELGLTTIAETKMDTTPNQKLEDDDDDHETSADETEELTMDMEGNSESIAMAEKQQKTQQNTTDTITKSLAEEKVTTKTTHLTIRRPEIAPRKPFMEEPKIRGEEEEEARVNLSASSVEEQSLSVSGESEDEDDGMDAGDKAIKKLKNGLSRYRKSSDSSADEAKHFNEKLAKVIAIATDGRRTHSTDSHNQSEKDDSSSSSSLNSLSSSESDSEPKKNHSKGNVGMSRKISSKKKVKHLSMEDVFGADSSDESSNERAVLSPRSTKTEPSAFITKKEIVVPKIKVEQKEANEIATEKEKAQNKSLLVVNEKGKRSRVSSVSSVSSIEQKRFKEAKDKKDTAKSPTTTTTASVRDRSKSDATALKKAHYQKKQQTATNKAENVAIVLPMEKMAEKKKTEMGKKLKQQQQQTKTAVGTPKIAIGKPKKNLSLMKELAKRKNARNKEEKKLAKTTSTALKRASGVDEKGQTAKRAKTENKERDEKEKEAQREKQREEEGMELVQIASTTASQCLDESLNASKIVESDDQQKQQKMSKIAEKLDTEQQPKENKANDEGAKSKNETDELLNIAAAEQMAENEFEIIDSGKVQNKTVEEDGEKKRTEKIKEEEEEKEKKKRAEEEEKKEEEKKKEEEEEKRKKKEEEEEKKKRAEEEEIKKKEEEEEMKKKEQEEKKKEEKKRREEEKKKEEQKKKRKEEEEEKKKREKEEEKKKREKEEEKKKREKEEEKKKREKEEAQNDVLTEEDDEEEMEAELLRRMAVRNEEEAAIASLGLQTKTDKTDSKSLLSDDIANIRGPTNEKCWKILEGLSEKEEKREETVEKMEEEKKENEKEEEEGKKEEEQSLNEKGEESVVEEETKLDEVEESTVSREQCKRVPEEATMDKNVGFKFETVERRASNESVDSHMAGVGNGFVEVDAEHLRQQKRDQEALQRLAEERKRTEETVKRMDETVDAVATNSAVHLQQQQQQYQQQQLQSDILSAMSTTGFMDRQSLASFSPNTSTAQQQQQQQQNLQISGGTAQTKQIHHMDRPQKQQHPPPAQQPTILGQNVEKMQQPHQLQHQQQQQQQIQRQQHQIQQLQMSQQSQQQQQQIHHVHANAPFQSQTQHILPSVEQQQQQQQVQQNQQKIVKNQNSANQNYPVLWQEQMPSISAAMIAAASASPHFPPSTLSNWPSIVAPPSTLSQGGALEELLRHGLLAPQGSSFVPSSGRAESAGTSAMTAPTSFDELFQQKMSESSSSPRGFPQHQPQIHQQMLANVPQRNVPNTNIAQQQQQQQQNLQISGGTAQTKQIHHMDRPQKQQHPPPAQQPTILGQNVEKMQQPHQLQHQQQQQQQIQRQQHQIQQLQMSQQSQQQQQQIHHVHANAPFQSQTQHILPSVEQQQQQQQVQQNQQKKSTTNQNYPVLWQEQMPSISAAMIAAASASPHFPPSTLSNWPSIVAPPSTLSQGGALEELLRHGLLAPQGSSFVPSSGRAESAGTSAMTAPTSFDELFQQKMSESSSSPRGFPQHQPQIHQQMLANVPQRNVPNTNIAQQQQQQQQNLQISGGTAQTKQIHHMDRPQKQQHPPPAQQPTILGQNVEKMQQPHQLQHQQQQQQQIQRQQHQIQQLQMSQQSQQQQQQIHHVHANAPFQSQTQHILPSVEQQQQQQQVQQNQQKIVKNQNSANKYPVLWQGQLAMKMSDTLVQMHKVCGNESLVQQMNAELSTVNENGIPLLRINQRMRLEQTHLENLIRKMEREDNQLALICLPCGQNRDDVVIQTQKMSISFIEYFSSKSAAGIVSSGPTQQPSAVVAHIFPPSDFSRMLLSRNAPDLLRTVESLNAGYLFVILTNK